MTPADFIRAARVDNARRLLEESSLPLKRLAFESGFGNVSVMRRAFLRSMGVRPQDYRTRFQSTSGAPLSPTPRPLPAAGLDQA
jgi:transcriptional regulator GlxA family with amidase domain